jgi:hypothetical protein
MVIQSSQQKPSARLMSQLRGMKRNEFNLISKFPYGYRNREDKTNLPPGVLIEGSKNVLTNVSERIQVRNGYSLDGPASAVLAPIVSSYTWTTTPATTRGERNLRSYMPANDTSDLVAYWNFDEDTGSTANDTSGNSHTGTLTNMEAGDWITGKVNYALDFDGTNEYVNVPDSDAFSFGNGTTDTPFSISAWVKMDDATNFQVISKYGAADTNKEWQLFVNGDDYLVMALFDDSEGVAVFIGRYYNTALTAYEGQWIHLAMTYSGSRTCAGIKLYINGTKVDNLDNVNGVYVAMENLTASVTIAKKGILYANGKIDEVRIYSKELTTGEILALYENPSMKGLLEYRYVDSNGIVTWRTLVSGLSSVAFNYAEFWDFNTEKTTFLLFVNGTSNIYEWSGGVTTYASDTANTITKQGTTTWGQEGLYAYTPATIGSATSVFTITNTTGTTYRYTWTGVGTDPAITATSVPVGTFILIGAQDFNAANNGLFIVTASAANYFEVINASGVAEANKTIGTGFIYTKFRKVITINGINYAYTGGEGTTTLTGVNPDPTGVTITAGDVITQSVIINPNASLTGLPATFANSLIANLYNQIYIGSFQDQSIYISKVDNYKDFSFAIPRVVGEGARVTIDSPPIGFAPLEDMMTITAGKNLWYKTQFTLGADLSTESLKIVRLKTTPGQASQSQALMSAIKNDVIFVSDEPTLDTLGRVENILGSTQVTNISDSIKLDFDSYDFTDASIWYNKYFIYLAIPKHGIIRMYNIVRKYWEASQTIPISRFYTVNGILYGHSYLTPESYRLFTGGDDNGHPIDAKAVFSYQNYGIRNALKSFNEFYVEGYISSNTILTLGITYDTDGCSTSTTYDIEGDDTQIVCIGTSATTGIDDRSLGKQPLGKYPLGGNLNVTPASSLPPKFRVIKTFPRVDFFENQISFESVDVDENWQILAFGPAITYSSNEPTNIKQ